VKLIAREDVIKNKMQSSADAIGAYCIACKSRIPFPASNLLNVVRHMNAKHKDIVDEYLEEEIRSKRESIGRQRGLVITPKQEGERGEKGFACKPKFLPNYYCVVDLFVSEDSLQEIIYFRPQYRWDIAPAIT